MLSKNGANTYNFLRGTKTSESMEKNGVSDLLFIEPMFSNRLKLSDIIVRNLKGGNSVIISGSAGGGKTSLITNIVSKSDLRFEYIENMDYSSESAIIVVRDLSAVASDYGDFIRENFSKRIFLVAGNEGALMNKLYFGDTFNQALDLLHKIKVGVTEPLDKKQKLVVVDLPALNPSGYAIKALLKNEHVLESVQYLLTLTKCCNDLDSCPRYNSLLQLKDDKVVEYISSIVSEVLTGHEVLFRDILDWIEDILLNGSCESLDDAPTSSWFWRIFFGSNKISSILKRELMPESSSIIDPNIRNMLINNDHEKIGGITNGLYYYFGRSASNKNSVLWCKIQFLILYNSYASLDDRNNFLGNYSSLSTNLNTKELKKIEIIRTLNNYFVQNKNSESDYLNLWCDFSLKRTSSLRNQECVLLGKVSSDKLLIDSAKVLSFSNLNSPDEINFDFKVTSGNRYLNFTSSNGNVVTLELTKMLLKSLKNGRPKTFGDRTRDSMDLSVRNFILECSTYLKQDSVSSISFIKNEGSQLIEKSIQLDFEFELTGGDGIYE